MTIEKVGKNALVARYCERQDAEAVDVLMRLCHLAETRAVTGWLLLECVDFSSSRFGEYVILPYGPGCCVKEIPTGPLSPRGLASDMSTVAAVADEVSYAAQ